MGNTEQLEWKKRVCYRHTESCRVLTFDRFIQMQKNTRAQEHQTMQSFHSSSLPSSQYVQHNSFFTQRVQKPSVPTATATVSDKSAEMLPRDVVSRFGLRLRELRRMHNMTQLRMAVDFGIDRSFISDVERGRKSISLHMLEVIALGMKVSLSDLLRGI
jgi:DNA-binding XRE family transcriptional regulator